MSNYDDFRAFIQSKVVALNFAERDKANELIESIYSYQPSTEPPKQPSVPKKGGHAVALAHRCMAKLSTDSQCTRRRLKTGKLCSYHKKQNDTQCPIELVTDNEVEPDILSTTPYEVIMCEINGLSYYIDFDNNVFSAEDIINGVANPRIIAQYVKTPTGGYSIPSFNL